MEQTGNKDGAPPPPSRPPMNPISLNEFIIFIVVIRVGIGGSISIAGMLANIVNIVIFYRQGIMSNSSTVVLAALALSDLCVCLFSTIVSVFNLVYFYFTDHSTSKLDLLSFSTIAFGRPLNLLIQFTCWITTLLAFERAVSVVFPFKVKYIFTPKRCVGIITLLFVLLFIIHIPNLFPFTIKWTADNIAVLVPTVLGSPLLTRIYTYISPVTLKFLSVFIVVTCNLVILWKVRMSRKFRASMAKEKDSSLQEKEIRQSAESESNKDNKSADKSSKEMKLTRMINIICLVFASCYLLNIPHVVVLNLVFKFNVDYHWMTENIAYNVILLVQLVNSSVNIIIYYKMSSRYKEEFQLIWNKRCRVNCR